MEEERMLEELIVLLEKLTIPVKHDRGNFKGGLVRYHNEQVFYINRKADISTKISLILDELSQIEIPDNLLSEELREFFRSHKIDSSEDSLELN